MKEAIFLIGIFGLGWALPEFLVAIAAIGKARLTIPVIFNFIVAFSSTATASYFVL